METKLRQTFEINTFEVIVVGKDAASNPGEAEKNQKAIQKLLNPSKKKVFVLFMSHRSGEHGLTIHNTIDEVKDEIQSVIDVIHEENKNTKAYREDTKKIKQLRGGYWAELSDSTWFDVFEKEV